METIKIILLIVAPVIISSSCENESIDSCQDFIELEIQDSCTLPPERTTVDRLKDAIGFFETVHLTSTRSVVIIRPEQLNDKISTGVVVPCNLPSNNLKEGQQVIFSGNLIEMYPGGNININFIGPPLELTSLKINCEDK